MSQLHQPLLYPSSAQQHHHHQHSGSGGGPPPLVLAAAHLDASKPRPARDVLWARLYAALLLACGALWALSALTQGKAYDILVDADAFLNDPTHCPATKGPWGPLGDAATPHAGQSGVTAEQQLRGLMGWEAAEGVEAAAAAAGDAGALPALLRTSAALLGFGLLLALGVSCVFVLLLQHVPGVLVFVTVLVQVALPAAWGVAALSAGNQTAAMWAFGLAGALAIGSLMSWDKLQQVASMLGLSAKALRDQPGLLVLSLALNLLLPAVWLLFGWATVAVSASGTAVANPTRASFTGGHCLTAGKEVVPCCVWQPAPWAPWYPTFASAMLVWTMLVLSEVKVFVASGAVCQWYYSAPPVPTLGGGHAGTSAQAGRGGATVRGATWRSLGHALGPSLGTLCAGGMVLFLTSWARYVLARWRRARENQGLLSALLACTVGCLLELLEQLTKFAVVRAAMTGQAFWFASQEVVGLLRRNAMDAYNVWWYPPLVLNLASAVLAATLSFISYKTTLLLWGEHAGATGQVDARTAAVTLGVLTGVASALMMSFVSGMVLHVLDAMWVCLAVDREQGCCTRPLVHQVLLALPTAAPGLVVQQPGGDLAYAAPLPMPTPTSGPNQGPYYTPSPLGHSPQDFWGQQPPQHAYPAAPPYAPQGAAAWQQQQSGGDPRYPHIQSG